MIKKWCDYVTSCFRTLCENDQHCCHWVFGGSTKNGKPKVCWLKREKGTLVNREEHKRKKVFSGSINCPGSSYEPKNCSKSNTVTSAGEDTTPTAGSGDSRSTNDGNGERTSTTDGNGSSSREYTTTTLRNGGRRSTTEENESSSSTTEGNEVLTSTTEGNGGRISTTGNGSSSGEYTTTTTWDRSTSGLSNRVLFYLLSILDNFAIDS